MLYFFLKSIFSKKYIEMFNTSQNLFRSINNIISIDDGEGGVLEGGALAVNNITIGNNISISGNLNVGTNTLLNNLTVNTNTNLDTLNVSGVTTLGNTLLSNRDIITTGNLIVGNSLIQGYNNIAGLSIHPTNNLITQSVIATPISGYSISSNNFSLTGYTGSNSYLNGTYSISSSSQFTLFNSYNAFNDDALTWSCIPNIYDFSTGIYGGSTYTITTGGNIYGEWLQINFPYGLTINGYQLQTANAGGVMNFSLVGSMYGLNWNVIDTNSISITNITNQTLTSFTISQSLPAYNYFRLICTKSYGATYCQVMRFFINGTLLLTNCLSLSDAGYVGIGTRTPSSPLDVVGNISLNGNLFVSRDLSLNQRLFLGGDASLNSKLFVANDVSMNQRLFLGGDVSFNSKLFVANDVSMNQRLSVGSDVSFNSKLFVAGNSSFNSNVSISALSVLGKSNFNNDVSMNANLVVGGNVLTNNNLLVNGNSNLSGLLSVGGVLSVLGLGNSSFRSGIVFDSSRNENRNSILFSNDQYFYSIQQTDFASQNYLSIGVDGDDSLVITGNGNTNIKGKLSTLNGVDLSGTSLINGNLVSGNTLNITNNSTLNGNLFLNRDASFNGNLFVSKDVSFNQRLFLGGDASFNGNSYIRRFLGVGTNPNSSYILDVSGNVRCGDGLYLNNTSQLNKNTLLFNNGTNTFSIKQMDFSNFFTISRNGSYDVNIKGSNGFVGIGTTDPAYILDVNGTSRLNNRLIIGNSADNISSSISDGNFLSGSLNVVGQGTGPSRYIHLWDIINVDKKLTVGYTSNYNSSNILDVNGTSMFQNHVYIESSQPNFYMRTKNSVSFTDAAHV